MNHKALPSIMDIDESPDPELFEGVDTGLEFSGNPLCCENIMHWWCYYMFLPQIVLGSETVLLTCSMFWGPRCPVTEPAIDDPRKEELLEVMPCNKNKLKWLPWWDHVDQVKSQKNWIEDAYVIRCCSIMSTAFSINILIYEDKIYRSTVFENGASFIACKRATLRQLGDTALTKCTYAVWHYHDHPQNYQDSWHPLTLYSYLTD